MDRTTSANLASLILAVLEDRPLHGYAIAREIERRSENLLRYGEGSLYPALRTLESQGHVQPSWDTAGPGPARKVYQITTDGLKELVRAKKSWRDYSRSIDLVLAPKQIKPAVS
jgi:PadR family transcriptional regulator PadR